MGRNKLPYIVVAGSSPKPVTSGINQLHHTVDGDTIMIITLPAGAIPVSYYVYDPTADDPSNHWYEFIYDGETGAQINGNNITLYFVDGKRGDSDLDPTNGTIVDPGGLSIIDKSNGSSSTSEGSSGGGCFISNIDL